MIFNKNDQGADELKALLGFIYKSNSFANMITYIGFAERDIRKVIGNPVFDKALEHYISENYQLALAVVVPPEEPIDDPAEEPVEDPPEEPVDLHPEYLILDQLVSAIQLPVALHAYRRYAPNNDLTHSDSGRSITVTETEKPAFEWMIDKSDKSLLELSHEATDLLLEFLEKYLDYSVTDNGPDPATPLIPWAASDEFKRSRGLFIKKDEFNEEFFIDGSRRVFLAIVPYIKKVQENEILSCLGKEKYDAMAEDILDGDLSDGNKILLQLVRPALTFLALSRAVISLSVEILPSGIFSNFITGVINSKTAVDHAQRVEISHALESQGLTQLAKLQEKIHREIMEDAGETYTQEDPTDRIDPLAKYVRI